MTTTITTNPMITIINIPTPTPAYSSTLADGPAVVVGNDDDGDAVLVLAPEVILLVLIEVLVAEVVVVEVPVLVVVVVVVIVVDGIVVKQSSPLKPCSHDTRILAVNVALE
jgi:hypothetical protein